MKKIGMGYKTLAIIKDGASSSDLDWIKDWNSNQTEINGRRIVTPRIFAGSVDSDKNPTGIALGKNIFGEEGPISSLNYISGLAAYNKGNKTFHLKTDGSLLAGFEEGSHISFDPESGELGIQASKITIGISDVATENQIDDKIDSAQGEINANLDETISSSSQDIIDYIKNNYATEELLQQVSEKVNTLVATTEEGLRVNLTESQTYTDKVGDTLESFVKKVTTQIDFTADGLLLGKSDSKFKAELSNTKLAFKQDTKEVAYISNNTLYITAAEIQDSLSIGRGTEGYFSWSQSPSGNLGLRWIGR